MQKINPVTTATVFSMRHGDLDIEKSSSKNCNVQNNSIPKLECAADYLALFFADIFSVSDKAIIKKYQLLIRRLDDCAKNVDVLLEKQWQEVENTNFLEGVRPELENIRIAVESTLEKSEGFSSRYYEAIDERYFI